MCKKLFSLILALLLVCGMVLSVSAETKTRVSDEAGLLSSDEIQSLEKKAQELSDSYGIDAVILTLDSLNGQSAQNCADDYYDSNGYGDDGVLLLLAMSEREWYISTCGKVIYALTDFGIQQLGDEVLPDLSSGNWYGAFARFLDCLPYYMDAYEAGRPVDGYADYSGDYYHGQQDEVVYAPRESKPNFLLSLVIGLAAGGITVAVMRSSMKTNKSQRTASVYLKEDSWHLDRHLDLFLYSNVSKTRKQQNTSSGGGSSVHRSSGGRSHGGGGGRF